MAKQTSTGRKKQTGKSKSSGPISSFLAIAETFKTNPPNKDQSRKIFAWSLLFFCVISILSCISYFFTGNGDQSATEAGIEAAAEVNNWLGFVGAKLSDLIIRRGFGIFSFVLLLYGMIVGLVFLENDFYDFAKKILKYVLFVVLFGSVFFSYIEILMNSTTFDLGGGFGYYVNHFFFRYVARVGMAFLLLFALVVFVVVNFNAELRASQLIDTLRSAVSHSNFRHPLQKIQSGINQGIKKNKSTESPTQPETGLVANTPKPPMELKTTPEIFVKPIKEPLSETKPVPGDGIRFELSVPGDEEIREKARSSGGNPQLEFTIVETKEEPKFTASNNRQLEQIGEDNIGLVIGDEDRVEKIVPDEDLEVDNADDILEDEFYDPTQELSDYIPPTFELLEDHGSGRGREVNREELENNKNKIVKTLGDYGIKIDHIKATIGPTVTLYEIVPAPGVRISKIRNLEDDIALSLAALGIRIIAPMPGQGTIGIEVPNSKPEVVSLRGVMSTQKFLNSKAELPIAIGRTISNEVFVADLNKMPHLLIAGATGQGKSVGLNTVITSLLYKKHPAEVKFILIDPKKVEMNLYQALKNHFLAQLPEQGDDPIITDVRDAVNVLKSLCIEMDMRYDLLKKARVRNLKEYNTKFISRKLNPRKGHQFLPYIVLIVDELADMMMVAGKEVEMPIARLAQLARAVGIHLVVATQRPSVNVITGIIKANFPARLSYRVISKVDSRTILDANGADQLVGRGDLLLSTGSDLIRIQNAFIDTPEVERVVEHIASQRGFPEPYFLPETPSEDEEEGDAEEPFEKDSKFEEAARMIVRYQIGSASLIQRKMKLGYNRAGRIIDQLERAGIVGPHSGSKARDVLITDEAELERYLSNISND
ncbi:MAG: DNA translocase FtsK [Bacteroidia bacterium]|nr:DNA translocase FtsK [Bacteroidia bacterium]